jgi:hypothetical protein
MATTTSQAVMMVRLRSRPTVLVIIGFGVSISNKPRRI